MAEYKVVYYGDRVGESPGGYVFTSTPIGDFNVKASTAETEIKNVLTEDQAAYTSIVLTDLIERKSLVITPAVTPEAIKRVQGIIDQFTQQESQRTMSTEARELKRVEETLTGKLDEVLKAVADMRAAFTPAKPATTTTTTAETTAARSTGLPKA